VISKYFEEWWLRNFISCEIDPTFELSLHSILQLKEECIMDMGREAAVTISELFISERYIGE
jgi:hypothetical protein